MAHVNAVGWVVFYVKEDLPAEDCFYDKNNFLEWEHEFFSTRGNALEYRNGLAGGGYMTVITELLPLNE